MLAPFYEDTHEMFRETVAGFLDREVVPNDEKWERDGIVDRDMYRKAAQAGLLGMAIPEEYGGGGVEDFRYNAIINEEATKRGLAGSTMGIGLHNDICTPYFLKETNDEQKQRWLPGIADGSLLTAVAMTEPGTGSDLASIRTTAVRDGDHYVINGSKTFISSGILCDLVIVAAKTNPEERHRGMSLIVVEADTPGFERGRNLDKIGLHAQDTAELFFTDMRVPAANLLGDEGMGFFQLMSKLPQERLGISVGAVFGAEQVFQWTLDYVKERTAFGRPIGTFQNSRFVLAECRTEIDMARAYVERQILQLNHGTLSAEDAAKSKWWCSEMQLRVTTRCLQLFGGYGYMEEYPIARAFRDSRIQTIYGGTTEIMKEIIGRSLGI